MIYIFYVSNKARNLVRLLLKYNRGILVNEIDFLLLEHTDKFSNLPPIKGNDNTLELYTDKRNYETIKGLVEIYNKDKGTKMVAQWSE